MPPEDIEEKDLSLRDKAWEARKAKISETNEVYAKDTSKVRLKGLVKLARSFTWGPIVNSFKGATRILDGAITTIAGVGKGMLGIVLGDKKRKKDAVELLKLGARKIVTGALSPVLGLVSDLYEGTFNIATGKRPITTLKSEISVQNSASHLLFVGEDQFKKDMQRMAESEQRNREFAAFFKESSLKDAQRDKDMANLRSMLPSELSLLTKEKLGQTKSSYNKALVRASIAGDPLASLGKHILIERLEGQSPQEISKRAQEIESSLVKRATKRGITSTSVHLARIISKEKGPAR